MEEKWNENNRIITEEKFNLGVSFKKIEDIIGEVFQ